MELEASSRSQVSENVEVKEYKHSGFFMHAFLVLKKNLLLKFRAPKQSLMEILLPTFFMLCLIPGWKAAGTQYNGERSFVDAGPNNVNMTDHAALYLCKQADSDPKLVNYQQCDDERELMNCIGDLCLPRDLYSNAEFWQPLLMVGDLPLGITVPDYDFISLIRNSHMEYEDDIPRSDFGENPTARALITGAHVTVVPSKHLPADKAHLVSDINNTLTEMTYTHRFMSLDFATEEASLEFVKSKQGSSKIWAIIVVNDEHNFEIRMNRTATPTTQTWTTEQSSFDKSFTAYLGGGWLTIHKLLMYHVTGQSEDINVYPMPRIPFDSDNFLAGAASFLPLILTLAFLYPVAQMVAAIVREKETRVREGMLIMGLSKGAFELSWVLTGLVQFTITAVFITITIKATFLHQTGFLILFWLVFFYCISLSSFSILLSVFFSKGALAVVVAPLVFLGTSIPKFAISDPSTGTKSSLSILNTYAFALGAELVCEHAERNDPITSHNAGDDDFSYNACIAMLVFDTVLYLILAKYFDAVMPSEWGSHKPWWFIFWPPYWCKKSSKYTELEGAVDGHWDDAAIEGVSDVSLQGKEKVSIKSLTKTFGSKTAVNSVCLKLYEGQILSLLGHNGAGKTTLINMLTGMLPTTSGQATVYGDSIVDELGSVRQNVGFCPQHNILWENMSCGEHLRYYGALKGVPLKELDEVVQGMLDHVGLGNDFNTFSAALSGGMKRKLSVAIALIGGSKFIIFDEPTAGMDVQARRSVWDLIKGAKVGRTILLTTHFMDEADLLGDSIAILHRGRVNCWGSSFFLKQKLGVGYNVRMESDNTVPPTTVQALIEDNIKTAPVTSDREHNKVELLSAAGSELSFRVPMWGLPRFPELFEALETKEQEFGIHNIGVSVTTLEEIFIKIANQDHDEEHQVHSVQQIAAEQGSISKMTRFKNWFTGKPNPVFQQEQQKLLLSDTVQPVYSAETTIDMNLARIALTQEERLQGKLLAASQFKGLFYKRYNYSKRDRCTVCFQLVLPVVLITFTLALAALPIPELPHLYVNNYKSGSIFPVGPQDYWNFTNPSLAVEPMAYTTAEEMNSYLNESYNLHKDRDRWQALVHDPATGTNAMFVNSSNLHSFAVSLTQLATERLRRQEGHANDEIVIANYPMPFSDYFKNVIQGFQAVSIGIFILLPFAFIPANYVSFLVKERESKAKHVQLVSGVRLPSYWGANFVFDLSSYMISTTLAFLVFAMFDRTEYVGSFGAFFATLLLFTFYGLTAIACSYYVSFFFKKHTTAQNLVMMANFMSAFVLLITVTILEIIDSTKDVAKVLRFVFRVIPSYCFGDGIVQLAQRPFNNVEIPGAFDMDVVGWDILFLAIMFPIYSALALSYDFPELFYKIGLKKPPVLADPEEIPIEEEEEEDVKKERQEVLNGRPSDVVEVKRLQKIYPASNGCPPKKAVKDLTFGVKSDEIFAFLGTNGAGKTTTISVLAGDFPPTSGTASISGYDVVRESSEAKRELGYCPQFDALIDLMTPKEHLELYCNLRGVPADKIPGMCQALMELLSLEMHKDTICKSLSGGNKRKTSVAISMIGGPACILLDEPTAGMDPVARRSMWTALQSIGGGRCVILTTHHLEEVEALAHRTAIMVAGGLQCLGTLQHLKNKYGGSYEVVVSTAQDCEMQVRGFFAGTFPEATLTESNSGRLTYKVSNDRKLSNLFRTIENARSNLGIVDYSISQTSLEQVFISICRQYYEAHHEEAHQAELRRSQQSKEGNAISRSIRSLRESLGM
eukprot:TRINITY_DN480_c0_g3_i1.p1 TRINITY_DN480_c0_g3~~TRINITY_DN480_c0_g3_i1.p1  ORF type:complete len:1772 (+),score=363.22 TRINITY_DN480_c0_g3_i1:93-5408(+)